MIDSFKTFFEARQEYVDKIQDAIDKVSDRPFNELFQGKGDRFLVKVFNPKFQKAIEHLGFSADDFDFSKRTLKGANINTGLKQKLNELINNNKGKDLEEVKQKLIDNFIKYKINIYEPNPLDRIVELVTAYKPSFEAAEDNSYNLYTSDNALILKIKFNKYFKEHYKLNEILDVPQVKQMLNDIINMRLIYRGGGFIDSLNSLFSSYVQMVEMKLFDIKSKLLDPIKHLKALKQAVDQNNIYYYLLFSRHPIDVLRMSDHKGISSCHRLGDGKYSSEEGPYADCALADAQNDGGIVYLIKGSDGKRISNNLNDKDIFHDKDRNAGSIQPIGRIRLRRFIDLSNGKDFAVPTTLQSDQKYGYITPEIYQNILDYTRKNQSIFSNPPEYSYAYNNIVLVGGAYSDESLSYLLNNFFGKEEYEKIQHRTNNVISWQDEVTNILNQYRGMLEPLYEVYAQPIVNNIGNPYIFVRIFSRIDIPYQQIWNNNGSFSENIDKVIEVFNSQKRMFKYWFKDTTRDVISRENQECSWGKNILDVNLSFSMSDPEDMYLIIENLLAFKRDITRNQNKIFKEINNWMMALTEE